MPKSNDRILRKIAKCLSLSESNNPNEAGRALAQAKKLMDMHGISQTDLDMASVKDTFVTVTKAQSIPKHLRYLMSIMRHVFGVKVISNTGPGGSNARFIGFQEAPEIAAYAYEVLAKQLMADRKDYLKSLGRDVPSSRKTRLANLFCIAWTQSVYTKVEKLKAEIPNPEIIDTWIKRSYDEEIRERRSRAITVKNADETEALADGREVGEKASLFHGMKGDPRAPMLEHQ